MSDYSTEAAAVADAMNAVYENKQVNKKNSITGDYSSDNESYPTVKAVKDLYGTKVTTWSSTVSDSNIASEKLVKDSLDGKVDTTDSRLTDARTPLSHNQASSTITDTNTYSHIGNTSTTQESINSAINTKLGEMVDINFVTVVQSLPTASASTMGKIYLVAVEGSGTNNYAEYITVEDSGSYSWEKFGEVSGSGLSVDWADITSKPSTYTPASHTHGNITNDGKVGSTSGKPLITTTSGLVTTGSFGTTSGTFAEGNHTHSSYVTSSDVESEIALFAAALAEAINPST